MKYKVNDRVRIKSLDWYNENKDEYGYIDCGSRSFFTEMSDWCGKIATIKEICKTNCYRLEECYLDWTDEMIEGLVEEEIKQKFKVGDKITNGKVTLTILTLSSDRYIVEDNFGECGTLCFNTQDDWKLVEEETTSDKVIEEAKTYWDSIKDAWICPEGYIFKDENGNVINATKIVLEKKKNEYPKTYENCSEVLCECAIMTHGYKRDLLNALQKLLICRDAYWKIAGEEMGLGKPWEPDYDGTFEDGTPIKYVIYNNGTRIVKERKSSPNHIFAFPTEEMRDAFYENFKELIESVKELL